MKKETFDDTPTPRAIETHPLDQELVDKEFEQAFIDANKLVVEGKATMERHALSDGIEQITITDLDGTILYSEDTRFTDYQLHLLTQQEERIAQAKEKHLAEEQERSIKN